MKRTVIIGRMPSFDLIAIGESLRDVFYVVHEATVKCQLQRKKCLLCLAYGEKIPVQSVVKVPAAGNSSNAAVSASRLGLEVALVTWIGQDSAGLHLKEALLEEGVDRRYLIADTNATNESTVLNFQGEKTQLVYFTPKTYTLPKLSSTRCIYYSAMGNNTKGFDRVLLKEIQQRPETLFIFQPGTTHIRAGFRAVKSLISLSHVLILNKEEAHRILGDGDKTVRQLMQEFFNLGVRLVIITDGARGADCFDGKTHWYMPVFPGKVIERTGAGDSFASAVTVALLKGKKIPEALRWGAANSLSVIQKIGPQAGLLTMRQMNQALKKFKKIQPRIVK